MSHLKQQTTLQRLSDNFISLVILQMITYGLPLLLIPYLIRILGLEGFGIYSFILAIIMYGVQLSDYGFELSATYHISLHKDNQSKKNEIFSSVLSIKFLIALVYFILLTGLILFVDKLFAYKEHLFLAFGIVFGQIIFPIWFFQGMEKMRYIMYINGFSKVLFVASIFIFVKDISDLKILILLNSLSIILAGSLALYVVVSRFDVRFSFQPWSRLYFYLKEGWYIFTSKFAVEFYTTINIIILGFFATPLVIGYYAVSVKIIHALGSLLDPLTRTVYPYLVNVYQSSNETFMSKNKLLSAVIFLIMFPITLLVGYYSKEILMLITAKEVALLNVQILQLFSLSLMVYLYGSQFTNMLVTVKETKFLNQILFLTAGINVLFAPIFVYSFGVLGMVALSVFIAFFVTLSKGYYLFFHLNRKINKKI